ncbi:hypothetical protein LTR91_015877 [Friedmanniomyces endolithicus]|uniref:Meiotically up-regulated gene 190 protein n=1 Tax=Friedmanniomyces endolithicus TaxID=329885 RepID=A0AAN6QLL1_9PEZI|nr:hypothetical protein LTR91_015877 [Friedmanniomyces endolithicus]
MSGRDDADANRRQYQAPYTGNHSIPTVQKYRETKENRQATAAESGGHDANGGAEPSHGHLWSNHWQADKESRGEDARQGAEDGSRPRQEEHEKRADDQDQYPDEDPAVTEDTSQAMVASSAKAKRKGMKKRKDERAERVVTDPVTHLPVTAAAEGMARDGAGRQSMQALFPPPEYARVREQLAHVGKHGVSMGLGGALAIMLVALGLERLLRLATERLPATARFLTSATIWAVIGLLSAGAVWALDKEIRTWIDRRVRHAWDDEIWEANRGSEKQQARAHENESVAWLNSLLAAVWPLVNPDLFTSLADELEDIMQASIPKIVRMVSVDDIGQGRESIRILGVRWLPTGAAARSVGSNGKLKKEDESKKEASDRMVPGQGEINRDATGEQSEDGSHGETEQKDDGAQTEVAEGMEAEEGDFINLEVAIGYRASSSMKKFEDRVKDMHLLLAFYLPGRVKVPVWVDLRGIVGTLRLRLQLVPDPPFFALCTLTFLGQPKVDISCVPLNKKGLNIMDLPLISNFVQSSVDAAMAEYVAPKSLTLDLKDMLAGDDFKKDTAARGVLVVKIKRGYEFKAGDPSIPLISEGGSDPYVSVGWAKLGKAMWSTRILEKEMEPCWEEQAYLLVTPDELNVDERLRVQLWDSDRFTADDDLGRIELDLKQLMRDPESNGRMQARKDGFRALKAGEEMPGKLEWEVGYFSKARIQPCQFEQQTYDKKIRSAEQLEQKVDEVCQNKLREAHIKGSKSRDAEELTQQRAQEKRSREDAMIISAPPPHDLPSGIFSIQIHQITGLELQTLNKPFPDHSGEHYDNAETGDEMPSAYCTVMINHSKVFRTRTKPKNARPFYNAGVERFVPDWQNCEVYVAVRDARVREDDPLLGIVHLPLGEVFKHRSQINGFYPLTGGVGFGRVRLSMVWRSVQLQAPGKDLGWQYGTLEVKSGIRAEGDLAGELRGCKLRLHSDLSFVKMYPGRAGGWSGSGSGEEGTWESKRGKSVSLPYKKRYCSPLAVEFTKHGALGAKTAAFAVFWLRELADEEEVALRLPVWKGDFKRARACCVEVPGERVGSITLTATFWSGLGGAHSRWANREESMGEVVEVLQVARDNMETNESAKRAGVVDEDGGGGSSGSEEGDSSEDERSAGHHHESGGAGKTRPDGDLKTTETRRANDAGGQGTVGDHEDGDRGSHDGSSHGGKQSLLDSAREYKRHMKSEHRRHRGLMQWRLPRTANHAVHKVESAGAKLGGLFKRHTREPDLETEA